MGREGEDIEVEMQPPTFVTPIYGQPAALYAQPPAAYSQVAPNYGQSLQQPTYGQPQQPIMYVYAPQGSYPLPGNPTLIAIPQGQAVPANGAPLQHQQIFALPNTVYPAGVVNPDRNRTHANGLAVAMLVTFLVGYFTFVTYLASIIISLHMVRREYIVKRKAAVIAFSILELIAWAFVVSFSWYYEEYCYSYPYYNYNYNSSYYYTQCYTMWWGWISFVVWGGFALAFGIPRVIFSWKHDSR